MACILLFIKPYKNAEWSEDEEKVHGISRDELVDAPSIENVALMVAGIFKVHESLVHKNVITWHASGSFDLEILSFSSSIKK